VNKELKRQLKKLKVGISQEKATEIVKTIYSIKAIKPKSKVPFEWILLLSEKQKMPGKYFGF